MTRTASTILVADADDPTRSFLAAQLTADGYDVLTARDGAEVKARATSSAVTLLVLGDLETPHQSIGVLREVRARDGRQGQLDPALPIVVLSGEGSELAVLRSLEAGADDHLRKPFSYPELRARIAGVLRRCRQPRTGAVARIGELTVDRTAREVRLRDERIGLSQKEFALLSALCEQPTRVYTKEELLRGVWGFRSLGRTRTLDSHACRLRQKLTIAAGDRFIVNVWGVGYRLVEGLDVPHTEAA